MQNIYSMMDRAYEKGVISYGIEEQEEKPGLPRGKHRLGQMRRGSLLRNRPGHCRPDASMRGKAILAAGVLPTGNEKGLLHFATAPSLLSQFWALEASLPKALAQ